MNAIVNGRLVLPDGVAEGQVLLYSHKIEAIVPPEQVPDDATPVDAKGGYVMPGLIDLHVHGYAGVDATTATAEELVQMSGALLKTGVTGFLATTMTADPATLRAAWENCRVAMSGCPTLLGVNAEGPFVSPAKCGAQDPAYAIPPDPTRMVPYADVIRLATVAPEWPGAAEAVRALTAAGITVAVGHTAADYDTVMACINAGATHATHLFNAMSGLGHRAPGAVGAVLNNPVTCELIADNHHVHPALYTPVWRIKGDRLCLITDCLAAGGLPAGEYTLGGAPVVSDGTLCRRKDGTLAGSAGTLMRNLKHFYETTHLPLWECVNCATRHPAAVLGLAKQKGALTVGCDADMVITNKGFDVTATVLGGETVYPV
ncbi:MAG: N-acetylglucosamine-6-phosphate deacetylase [Ruminococcaceae bacterium]|nr:N-acetylglucosamine-6-phosphate deacetylase [Oscillospiraceae bacterium]